jgi:hypothetical protein
MADVEDMTAAATATTANRLILLYIVTSSFFDDRHGRRPSLVDKGTFRGDRLYSGGFDIYPKPRQSQQSKSV